LGSPSRLSSPSWFYVRCCTGCKKMACLHSRQQTSMNESDQSSTGQRAADWMIMLLCRTEAVWQAGASLFHLISINGSSSDPMFNPVSSICVNISAHIVTQPS
jgi:hypothetical protein